MKIVHITYGLGFGGIETMLVNIANEQAKLGHEVHVIVINDIIEEDLLNSFVSNVKVHLLNRKRGSKNPLYLYQLNKELHAIAPDVIHLHYASISRYIFFKNLRSRVCVTLHDMCTPVNSKYLHKSGPVFAISEMVQSDIKKVTGLESTVVFNGIDMNVFKERTNEEFNNPFRIVQVSRLMHRKKGQDILIQALKILVSRGVSDIKLTFIGDGESMAYLRSLTETLELEDKVEFLGKKSPDYISSHLRDYDLFVQPSRFEGFGLTVAEAMAARVPVLVSDNQAPMEIISGGKFGYHFTGGDAADCANRIEAIMKRKKIDKELVGKAFEHVKENYSVRSTAKKYLELYDKLILK